MTFILGWLALSAVTAAGCAALIRGGQGCDPMPIRPNPARDLVPSPRRGPEGMAESGV